MDWAPLAQFEGVRGDRVALFSLDDGHWAVSWAYGQPHGPQLVSYAPGQAQDVFSTTRRQYEEREGLSYDSRVQWQGGSL
ncbi:hypothetical protein [Streptomyces anulatus]|uniref:hypothetical protein n=1 Tax=Streptomyces anulatus TaxID=1892 RepID=UPI00342A0FB7